MASCVELDFVDTTRSSWDRRLATALKALAESTKTPLVRRRPSPLGNFSVLQPYDLTKKKASLSSVLSTPPFPSSNTSSSSSFSSFASSSSFQCSATSSSDRVSSVNLLCPRCFSVSSACTCEESGPAITNCLFNAKDLFGALVAIPNPNCAWSAASWGSIKLHLRTPTLPAFRAHYDELHPRFPQLGIDDRLNGSFMEGRIQMGTALLSSQCSESTFKQVGVPSHLRSSIWSSALGQPSSPSSRRYYQSLLAHVQRWELVTDALVRLDVQRTADHDEFFVFEETLHESMLVFSRDSEVLTMCPDSASQSSLLSVSFSHDGHMLCPPPSAKLISLSSSDAIERITVPPSGVVPFQCQSMLAAPLCFLFDSAEYVYEMYRLLYLRYFHTLHTVSSSRNSLIFLCQIFESLCQHQLPQVYFHCLSLDVPPLRVAFPWLFTLFSGFLPVEQVLHLWDRLIAYDSLDLVAVLAFAIFNFRAEAILKATSSDDILVIFREMSTLQAIPLLQHCLFSKEMQ